MVELKLTPENLREIADAKKWPGQGTGEDPLIISQINDPTQKIIIHGIQQVIEINRCKLDCLILKDCTSIIVKGCSLEKLKLHRVFESEFLNNKIRQLKCSTTGSNRFQDNQLSRPAFKTLDQPAWIKGAGSKLLLFLTIAVILYLALYLQELTTGTFPNYLPFYIVLISIIGALLFVYHLLKVRWEDQTLPSNILKSNKIVREKEIVRDGSISK